MNAVLDKIGTIEIEVFEGGRFVPYKTITKDNISKSLLPIGEDFLIIRIDKSEKHFTPFLLADDRIEEKSMRLYGVSGEAQDIITPRFFLSSRNRFVRQSINVLQGNLYLLDLPVLCVILWPIVPLRMLHVSYIP